MAYSQQLNARRGKRPAWMPLVCARKQHAEEVLACHLSLCKLPNRRDLLETRLLDFTFVLTNMSHLTGLSF